VRFAVFGLGNSIWTKTYQQFPRWVDQALERLGGNRVLPLGEGDETTGSTEAAFTEFIRALSIAIEVGTQTLVSQGPGSHEDEDALHKPLGSSMGGMQDKFIDSTLVGRRALFDDDATGSDHRAVYHLEFARKDGQAWTYNEGDYLTILPITANVEALEVYYKLSLEYDTVRVAALDVLDFRLLMDEFRSLTGRTSEICYEIILIFTHRQPRSS
jgi:cytochrome P450/NADPH-cytochrome P450 reductase